jgi:hypothetical protein
MNAIAVSRGCVILMTLVGCGFESVRGSGPISLSERVEQAFERYKNEDNPKHFAISLDGEDYGFSICPDFKCSPEGQKVALDSCTKRSNGKVCKLYASGRSVIWNGTVDAKLENQLVDDWSGLRSDRSANEVNVTFRNQTSEALSVYWIDFEGQRKPYGVVDPGREKKQSTLEGHRWELESDSGQLLGRFTATAADSTAEVNQNRFPRLENQLADDWSGLRSDRNANEVDVTFRNQTSEALALYWIDFEGQRKSYGEVDPGRAKKLYTFEGHRWELESGSGQLLGRFIATAENSVAEVSSDR